MDKISVNRPYDCYCGQDIAFEYVGTYIREHEKDGGMKDRKILVVSDRNVGGYFYSMFEEQFLKEEIRPYLVIIDATDMYKNLSSVAEVIKSLVDFSLSDGDWVIALGGGGVIDIASFACGVYNSELKLILVPTTLNAMAEGAISEKALLNSGSHKSVLCAKSNVKVVFADPYFLKYVPVKVKTNGYAAVIRYAVLADPSLLKELLNDNDLRPFLTRVYETRTKIEKKNPHLLTMGQEVAGAIESYFRFMNYSEGETLALSIYAAVPVSYREAMKVLYNKLGLPYELKGVSSRMILKNLEERFRLQGDCRFEIADLAEDGKSWKIRRVTADEAYKIMEKRIGVICAE